MTSLDRAPSPVASPLTVRDAPAVPGLAFRHATPTDWDVLADLVNRARTADGVDEIRSGEGLRAEYEPLDMFRIDRDVVVAEVDGAPVGFASGILVHRDGALTAETWGIVVPEWRHRGIGTAMWRRNRDRLAAEAAADPRPGPRELRTYALEIEHSDRGLIADQGYVPIRFGFEMRRYLTGALPDHPMPDGLEIRPVTPETERAIFDADNEAFEDHWGHREQTDGDFIARFRSPEVDTALWRVAWDGDEIAGVVITAIFVEDNEALGVRRGWLDHVSVRRPWRGRGLAKALCAASFRALRDAGMDEAWLGVDASNPTGALQLYETLGFSVVRRWEAFGRPLDGPAPQGWVQGADPESAPKAPASAR
jgi:mycothiol synthase